MNENEFLDKVTEIFREELDQDDLVLHLGLKQTDIPGWDSLAHIRIIVATETAFGIQLEASEVETANTVQKLFDLVQSYTAATNP